MKIDYLQGQYGFLDSAMGGSTPPRVSALAAMTVTVLFQGVVESRSTDRKWIETDPLELLMRPRPDYDPP